MHTCNTHFSSLLQSLLNFSFFQHSEKCHVKRLEENVIGYYRDVQVTMRFGKRNGRQESKKNFGSESSRYNTKIYTPVI